MIARTITDMPLPAGIWCAKDAIVVAVKGRVIVANRNHLDGPSCREVGEALIEAADYLDGRGPAALGLGGVEPLDLHSEVAS